jgi:FKBP-type peptidyl-prolyl cis-trans isomerase (trigger factor)
MAIPQDNIEAAGEPYYWGEETFATKEELIEAIQEQIVQELDNADSGHVEHGAEHFNLRVTVELVPAFEPGEEGFSSAVPPVPESVTVKKIVNRLLD